MTVENESESMYSGDDVTLEVETTDSDGDPVDLSGSELQFALVDDDGSTVVEKTDADGIDVEGSDDNVAAVQLDSSDTADLEGKYRMELEETAADGTVATLMRGVLYIKEDLIE